MREKPHVGPLILRELEIWSENCKYNVMALSLFGLVKHFYKSELQKKILTHDVARNFFQKFPDAQFLIPANIQRKILIRR